MWKKIIFELWSTFLFFLKYNLPCSIEWAIEFERFPVSQHSINHCRLWTFLEIKQKSASISENFLQLLKEVVSPTAGRQSIDCYLNIWPNEFEIANLLKNGQMLFVFFFKIDFLKNFIFQIFNFKPKERARVVSEFVYRDSFLRFSYDFLNIFRTVCEKKNFFLGLPRPLTSFLKNIQLRICDMAYRPNETFCCGTHRLGPKLEHWINSIPYKWPNFFLRMLRRSRFWYCVLSSQGRQSGRSRPVLRAEFDTGPLSAEPFCCRVVDTVADDVKVVVVDVDGVVIDFFNPICT